MHSKLKTFFLITLSSFLLTSCSNLDIQTLNFKAKQLMDGGDVDGAIGRLQAINDLNPNFPQTHYNLGIAYYKKGEPDKAIESLNKALDLDNKLVDAYYTLGVIYEDIAITDIEKATKDKSIGQLTVLNAIIKNLQSAHNFYSKYLNMGNNTTESENIKIKLESLNNDIDKYQTILIEKYGSPDNN